MKVTVIVTTSTISYKYNEKKTHQMDHQCWCCCTYRMLHSFGFVVGLHSYSTVVVEVLEDLVVLPILGKTQEHCCNCMVVAVEKLPNLGNL